MTGVPLDLCPGDLVMTDFHNRVTKHKVIDRRTGTRSQSGVMYRVEPWKGGSSWIDAAWFHRVPPGDSDA